MRPIPTSSATLGESLTYYVETVSSQKRSYKTEIYRIRAISDLLGHLTLEEITPTHVVRFRDERLATPNPRAGGRMLATSTVKLELMLLSHLFSTAAVEWGMENLVNPVLKIRKPKPPPGRSRRLTSREETKLLRAALRYSNHEMYGITVLALETAMRQAEILGMQWENVSWKKRTALLPMTKNGDVREVPLSRAAYNILRNHMEPKSQGRIFSYSSNGFKSSWRSFLKGTAIPDLHFHDLRHCCISSLIERGLNTMEVAAISGHKSMAMLKRYSHLYAYKLVPKLDPKPKTKKERPILREQLPSYPALVTQHRQRVDVEFPDFIDLSVSGSQEPDVIAQARFSLLRKVIGLLCDGREPPTPSHPDTIDIPSSKSRVEMVSPL